MLKQSKVREGMYSQSRSHPKELKEVAFPPSVAAENLPEVMEVVQHGASLYWREVVGHTRGFEL